MIKEILIQPGIFHEDQADENNQVEVAKRYFDVVETVALDKMIREDRSYTRYYRGSITLASVMRDDLSWTDVISWLPPLRSYYVAENYYLNSLDYIRDKHKEWPVFIRPCSGRKTFSGNVYTEQSLENEYLYLRSRNVAGYFICLVAKPVKIEEEFRCIFVNGEYISGSRYMVNGELSCSPCVPEEAVAFAKEIAGHPFFMNRFDFVIDVGISHGKLKLIEINKFETSSFYEADLDKVFEAYSKA